MRSAHTAGWREPGRLRGGKIIIISDASSSGAAHGGRLRTISTRNFIPIHLLAGAMPTGPAYLAEAVWSRAPVTLKRLLWTAARWQSCCLPAW